MNVQGIVWAGVRTERFAETVAFFRDVVALPVRELRDDFAWFELPDSSQFEIFGPTEPDHDHFVTGPVPSFHVDDVYATVEELRQSGALRLRLIYRTEGASRRGAEPLPMPRGDIPSRDIRAL